MNKFKQLHITLENIHELNHFVYTHSKKNKLIGKNYTAPYFHRPEEYTQKDPWLYKINKHGYRGDDWAMNRNVVTFFGCSITFGVGVEQDVASAVQKKINTECINMGQPGASALTVLKTFSTFLKYYPVNTAVITLPSLRRVYYPTYENYDNGRWNYQSLLPNWINDNQKDIYETAFKFFNEDTCAAYLYDYIQMAKTVATLSNTKIIWSSWDLETLNFLKSIIDNQEPLPIGDLSVDIARDNMHPGPKVVENWALNLSQEIKKHF